MTKTEVEQRLQEGLQRVARLDDRDVDEVRQDAIRDYLARRGVSLLKNLASTSPGSLLSDEEALEFASEELSEMRREREA